MVLTDDAKKNSKSGQDTLATNCQMQASTVLFITTSRQSRLRELSRRALFACLMLGKHSAFSTVSCGLLAEESYWKETLQQAGLDGVCMRTSHGLLGAGSMR